jgi:hypothetical protein
MTKNFDIIISVLDTVYSYEIEQDAIFRSIVHQEVAAEIDAIVEDPFNLEKYDSVINVLIRNLGSHAATRMSADAIVASIGKADLIPRTKH